MISPPNRMLKTKIGAVVTLSVLCLAALPGGAKGADQALPRYVLGPPGKLVEGADFRDDGICFSELFDHPDQWKETRAVTDCLLYADWSFNIFSDADLQRYFAQMKQWNIKLELEVGALKEWKGGTGESTFRNQEPMWDRLQRLGGNIYSLAFDEPLCCVRNSIHKPDAYAVEETAKFIALVRKKYPQFVLGDIEAYPSINLEDHIKWITALQKRLAEMNVKGLDFYRLDVDWNRINNGKNQGSWPEVKKIQEFCNKNGLPFSLIYWAADYSLARGLADDSTWYIGVMSQGYAYACAGGVPQQYVVESWVGAPTHSVPETADSTFTRSGLDFYRKFVKPAK